MVAQLIERLDELEQTDLTITARNSLESHLSMLKDKGIVIDVSVQEHLKLNTLNSGERTDEQIDFLLQIAGKSSNEWLLLAFTYNKFIDKQFLNRNSRVCQALFQKPNEQVPSRSGELHKNLRKISLCVMEVK